MDTEIRGKVYMDDLDGLICAFIQSPNGWQEISWNEITGWSPKDELLWVHLDTGGRKAIEYLESLSSLDPLISEHLLAEESRPRTIESGSSTLINLRGVNLNPGAEPEDMVAIRLWFGKNIIVSTRRRRLLAINDIRELILDGKGPKNQSEFIAELVGRLIDRMAPVIEELEEQEDKLEEQVISGSDSEIRTSLSSIRRQSILLRRYLSPQREALNRLQSETIGWIEGRDRANLRETNDKIQRYIEELDAVRERATVIQDEVMNKMSEQLNRNMYILAIVATVMLPLGFVTGLLGVNVDGIPGADNSPWAFAFLIVVMFALVFVEVILLKRFKIF